MATGKFIVIEGGDGAGKDTQIALLQKEFSGSDFVYTREPGGTALGKAVREMLLHATYGELPLLTEVFLFLADRAEHVAEVVSPALKTGKVVISNRSWVSMVAYQIYGRDRFDLKSLVEEAIGIIYKECPVDLALILDVPPEVGIARQRMTGKTFDVMENMGLPARERIRNGFLDIAKALPVANVIDSDRPVEDVYRDVRNAFQRILEGTS